MASNIMLVVFMIIVILLLFTTMIFSAMASDKTKDCGKNGDPTKCTAAEGEKCHKNSMYAALITGLSAGLLGVCLIIYIYSSKDTMKGEASDWLTGLAGKLSPKQLEALAEASK